MKKISAAFLILAFISIAAFSQAGSQSIKSGSKITVSLPVLKNASAGEEWIPLHLKKMVSEDF